MSKNHHHSRRTFLGKASYGCASIGLTTLLSGWTNMSFLNAAANVNLSLGSNSDYKALVCVMLAGGNDSYNMLIPRGTDEYAQYAEIRSNLAIAKESILPLNPINTIDRQLGLHPNMPNIQGLFENGKVSFLANAGALVQPTTVFDFQTNASLPLGLFSHSDQRQHWQTSVPQDRDALGWAGRMTDLLHGAGGNPNTALNISMSGLNLFQRGNLVDTMTLKSSGNGATLINGSSSSSFKETIKRQTIDNLMEKNYVNILEKAYSNSVTGSKTNSIVFDSALAGVPEFTTIYPDSNFGDRLKMIAKVIGAREALGVQRQTFFVSLSGFDTHDNILEEHGALMGELDSSLAAFYKTLDEELGVANNVTTFTMSDFSRKLISNGDGSDHAWGGHSMIMGGGIQGQRIFGQYPDLYEGAPLDIGSGRIIPTTSCDEYFAELAMWFGASHSDLDLIFPNLRNFWTPNSSTMPLGLYA